MPGSFLPNLHREFSEWITEMLGAVLGTDITEPKEAIVTSSREARTEKAKVISSTVEKLQANDRNFFPFRIPSGKTNQQHESHTARRHFMDSEMFFRKFGSTGTTFYASCGCALVPLGFFPFFLGLVVGRPACFLRILSPHFGLGSGLIFYKN